VAEGAAASPETDGHQTDHGDAAASTPSLKDEQGGSGAGEAPSEHEAKLEHDLEELAARAGKADEYLELAQRTKADFENYRRRSAREAAAAQQRGIVKLAQELLPAVDDLDRAVAAAQVVPGSEENQDGTGTLVSGIKLVHAGVIAALARVGIEPYSPLGERFDPQHHEAVAQQPVQGADPGTIVEVYQRGYRLHDGSVLRPARVVVAA
jgi:molecular chaperone GrpE